MDGVSLECLDLGKVGGSRDLAQGVPFSFPFLVFPLGWPLIKIHAALANVPGRHPLAVKNGAVRG